MSVTQMLIDLNSLLQDKSGSVYTKTRKGPVSDPEEGNCKKKRKTPNTSRSIP